MKSFILFTILIFSKNAMSSAYLKLTDVGTTSTYTSDIKKVGISSVDYAAGKLTIKGDYNKECVITNELATKMGFSTDAIFLALTTATTEEVIIECQFFGGEAYDSIDQGHVLSGSIHRRPRVVYKVTLIKLSASFKK